MNEWMTDKADQYNRRHCEIDRNADRSIAALFLVGSTFITGTLMGVIISRIMGIL